MTLINQRGSKLYSYKDYLSWPMDERWEIVEGVPYAMTLAPLRIHQEVLGNLFFNIKSYLLGKKCKVYTAPFDVRLCKENDKEEEVINIVQPDITVICDEDKLDEKGAKGAPDFVIEIVSPSSASLDYVKKLNLYEGYGVKEYWIVDPKDKNVLVYRLDECGNYGKPYIYQRSDSIKISIFEDLVIDFGSVFELGQ